MRTLLVTLTTCLLVLPAYAKYSGGSGTAQDPYQIATAADLIALGETPGDYDKHFILTANIDLDPNLPGRKVFDKAVIAADTSPNGKSSQSRPPLFPGIPDHKNCNPLCAPRVGAGRWRLLDRLGPHTDVKNIRRCGSAVETKRRVGRSHERDPPSGERPEGVRTPCSSTNCL